MKTHILLVDDDEDDVHIFTQMLTRMHFSYKCTWAKSCEQALDQLVYLRPDIIFLDINMPPRMNGFECLARIKSEPLLQHIPVVLHSSIMPDEFKIRGKHLGAAACLTKPDNIAELAIVVEKFITGAAIRIID